MPDPIPSLAEIRDRASMRCLNPSPAMADAIADRRALLAAVEGVLAVHVPCDNDPARTPICETCHGKAGVWECGCWADEDRVPVCSTCTDVDRVHNSQNRTPWPCATVRAITAHVRIEEEVDRG